jgi:hypothetical protein
MKERNGGNYMEEAKLKGMEQDILKNKMKLANLVLQMQEIIDTVNYLEEEYEKAQTVIK